MHVNVVMAASLMSTCFSGSFLYVVALYLVWFLRWKWNMIDDDDCIVYPQQINLIITILWLRDSLPGQCLEWAKTWTCCRVWFGRSPAHPVSNNIRPTAITPVGTLQLVCTTMFINETRIISSAYNTELITRTHIRPDRSCWIHSLFTNRWSQSFRVRDLRGRGLRSERDDVNRPRIWFEGTASP